MIEHFDVSNEEHSPVAHALDGALQPLGIATLERIEFDHTLGREVANQGTRQERRSRTSAAVNQNVIESAILAQCSQDIALENLRRA